MTDDVKKTDITQEQIDFILADLERRNYRVNASLRKAQEGVSAEEWLKSISSELSKVNAGEYAVKYIQSIKPFVLSNFSEMSDAEKISYIKMMPKTSKSTAAWMLNDSVRSAKTFDEFKNNLLKIAKDPDTPAPTYQEFTKLGTVRTVEDVQDLHNSKSWCFQMLGAAETYSNYPVTPKNEPEPVIEKPNWFETTSKDKKVRVDQWMEHLGLKDNTQALIDKYGLPVAYEIVQTSMLSPADMTKATDGKFKNSKNTIKYFLDNDVTAEKLETIPDLDKETVKASLDSVKKVEIDEKSNTEEEPTVVSIDISTKAVSVPTKKELSISDMQKIHYAALMRDSVKLQGIEDDEIKAAVDIALKASLQNETENIESWSGNFKYNLSNALGLDKITQDKTTYQNWAASLNNFSTKAIETATSSKPSPELAEQVANYTNVAMKQNLKSELAGMSATESLNPETYFKDRQVQKRIIAKAQKDADREEKKAEREAKRTEKSDNRQEKNGAIKEWLKRAKSMCN